MLAWVGRELGLYLLPPHRLSRGDLDLPQVLRAVNVGGGLARSTTPTFQRRLSVLDPRLPAGWRPAGGLADVGSQVGRIVFCTQRPSLLVNSDGHAGLQLVVGWSVGETVALVPCSGHDCHGRGSSPSGRR